MHTTPSHNGHPTPCSPFPSGPRFTVPSPNGVDGPPTLTEPSSNGANGPPTPSEAPSANGANGRDTRGRFAKGNRGGPGNPFARRVARLRTLLLEIISEEDLREVLRKLVERARAGDLASAKLLLSYLIGRPVEAVDPDRLDLEEWRLLQEAPNLGEVFHGQRQQLDAGTAAALALFHQKLNQEGLLAVVNQRLNAAKAEGEETR